MYAYTYPYDVILMIFLGGVDTRNFLWLIFGCPEAYGASTAVVLCQQGALLEIDTWEPAKSAKSVFGTSLFLPDMFDFCRQSRVPYASMFNLPRSTF